MELQGLTCNGCGSSDVVFDPVTRKLHCNQCGREEYYSRAQLGANGKVAFTKDNAIQFFKSGNRVNARKFASDVLNIMQDNAAALFILAYCDEFVEGRSGAIKEFFRKIDDVALEYDEVRDLINLFTLSLYNLRDYESDMEILMVKNMQSERDRPELEKFIETVSPYCIGKYPSADFMTAEHMDLYCDLAANCNIPKTCFALLKGIQSNPDSPYVTKSFYMKARTQYFHDHYVLPVGRIINAMKESPGKSKFLGAFSAMLKKYESDATIA
ncbi:MAG: hypothetical protein SPF89_11820 [Sphaerochaetaceae bacterium]|nr:hypothetical protein [Spirochaetales bacterium]MDY5500780.1 hypothetical protein [Sphaerochaetaceae bacterium]